MNIFLVGRGSVLLACAEILRAKGLRFSVLEPKEGSAPSFTLARMTALGIPAQVRPAAEVLKTLRTAPKPLLIFSIVNNVLFPPDIAEAEDITLINYHNALLPGHRGRHCEAWQIFCQEEYAGVTWHYLDRGVDTGAVICQSTLPTSEDITSIQLLAQQGREAVRLFKEYLPAMLRGERRQNGCAREKFSPLHYSWEKPNGGVLNTEWEASKAWAFLRAMDYGCLYTLGIPVFEWKGMHYTWQRYAKEGILRGHAGAGTCLTGSVMTLAYPAGQIVLQGCQRINEKMPAKVAGKCEDCPVSDRNLSIIKEKT